jgi:hypothetical protein
MNDRPLPRCTLTNPVLAAGCLLLAILTLPARAQSPQTLRETPPADLVHAAIQKEIHDDAQLHLFSWKARKVHGHSTQVERDVQTPSGTVTRLILINDQPLTPEQQRKEDERVRSMIDPQKMRQSLKDQQADDARTRKMLGAIPDAFDFVFIESVSAPNGHKFSTFKFTPRSAFDPPSREIAVFTGMQGNLVLDETDLRLVKVDGTLFKDVNFGWGILGRLYKGGRFLIEKSEITPDHWDSSRTFLHFDGKALLFKSIHVDDDETDSDYQPVPPMTAGQALDYLTHSNPPQDAKVVP